MLANVLTSITWSSTWKINLLTILAILSLSPARLLLSLSNNFSLNINKKAGFIASFFYVYSWNVMVGLHSGGSLFYTFCFLIFNVFVVWCDSNSAVLFLNHWFVSSITAMHLPLYGVMQISPIEFICRHPLDLYYGGFYKFCIYFASLWDAVLRCLSVTALRLRLVPCY